MALRNFQSYVSIGEESTWGTPVSTTASARIVSSSLAKTTGRGWIGSLDGRVGMGRHRFDQQIDVGGDVVIEPWYASKAFGMLLKHALGAVNTTGSGPYTHAFSLAADLPTGLTVETGDADTAEVFAGCRVSRLGLSVAPGGLMSCTAGLIGKDSGGRVGETLPTLPASPAFVSHAHAGSLSWNSLTPKIRSFALNLNNNLQRRSNLGSLYTDEPILSVLRDISIALTIEADDAVYAAYQAGTIADATVTFTGPSSQSLAITLQNALILQYNEGRSGQGIRTATLTLQAADDGTDPGLTVSLVNANASAV